MISPTWVATTVYSSPDAARFFGKICDLYGWTTLFIVHDKLSQPVFYAGAGAVIDQFSSTSKYQLTTNVINASNAEERSNSLRLFATVGRVLFFFGHAEPFRLFMITAFGMNMTNSEYFLPHVATARYTISMAAQMLNESRSLHNVSFNDGRALAKLLSNRSFTVDGKKIVMDKFGQRQMNWTLGYYDEQTETFEDFLLQNGAEPQLVRMGLPLCRFKVSRRPEGFVMIISLG
ncbi:hypothetical protein BV898_02408 [Hypsibius exemplaris]|uniref:Receptor ligand binding region domain-containing protein n=1 Tax=Hypsibius exemplaris TaxID=2072580 RepID=A0A1W0X8E1_HYPEX|nr:hypothetical protein BV898_02408 [Hypsibius exemplaris]